MIDKFNHEFLSMTGYCCSINQNGPSTSSTIGDSCVHCCLNFLPAEFKNGIRRKLSPENFSLLPKLYEVDVPCIQKTIGSPKLEDLFVCQ